MPEPEPFRTVLWALRGRQVTLTCVLQPATAGTELQLLWGGRVAARHEFSDRVAARRRAATLRDRLMLQGWWDAKQ